jgi:hypothetical protein
MFRYRIKPHEIQTNNYEETDVKNVRFNSIR